MRSILVLLIGSLFACNVESETGCDGCCLLRGHETYSSLINYYMQSKASKAPAPSVTDSTDLTDDLCNRIREFLDYPKNSPDTTAKTTTTIDDRSSGSDSLSGSDDLTADLDHADPSGTGRMAAPDTLSLGSLPVSSRDTNYTIIFTVHPPDGSGSKSDVITFSVGVAVKCTNRRFLNYIVENNVPTHCVINRPRDRLLDGKCVKMADLWDVFRTSKKEDRQTGTYWSFDHQWISHYEYLIHGDEGNAWIGDTLRKARSVDSYMPSLAPDLSFDEVENTPENVQVCRDIQCTKLQPYSLCKILLDNNIFQFLPKIPTQTCPKITSECAPSKFLRLAKREELDTLQFNFDSINMGDGIKYGVKFEGGLEQKCHIKSINSTLCVPLEKALDMINKFDGVDRDGLKSAYSRHRRKIYDGLFDGFLEMRRSLGLAGAIRKLDAILGLVEPKTWVQFGGQGVEIGSVTMCIIFSMHVPFSKQALLEKAEVC